METFEINSLNESIFYQNDNITISSDNNKTIKEKGKVCITSKNIYIDNIIKLSYEDLIFHAINKEKNFVLLSSSKKISKCKNNTINLKSENLEEIKQLYDSITKGINNYEYNSLNEEDNNIEKIKINDNKNNINDIWDIEQIKNHSNLYIEYNYTNSIDNIFKSEKIPKEEDPYKDKRRFEDAD